MKLYTIFFLNVILCLPFISSGQDGPTPFHGIEYRNIGPSNQGGRIVDIEANRNNFKHVVMATASGGVWQSSNAGTTWDPIFDDYETASIGDIAMDPNDPSVIWVGTGEANNRNSVSWGNGIYVTRDGGQTFQNKGLKNTHQIARVLVNPDNSDDICACAIGHLWGYSGDRGLFQSLDGGNTWNKLSNGIPNDGKTGCTDIVRDPNNPNTLYAAMYHRLRKPWHFHSGGEQGGIYKSTDNGKSWTQLENGLPAPTGRIGLAIYEENPEILMALVEAERSDTLSVLGSGIYRSEDGGDSWSYVNTYNNRPFYYSQIRINPQDHQRVYVMTTSFMTSTDGGHTLENGSPDYEVHGDFHAMWLDPNDNDRYYIGADKGMSLTHNHGDNFILFDNLPIAQFYRINYDMQDPYYVYGGLQDNGSYATASFGRDARGILNDKNWKMHWGDGQDSAFNPYDYTDGYSSMEKGSYFKYNPKTRKIKRISPSAVNTPDFIADIGDINEDPELMRFNWSAPLVMSPHDPSTIYVGGNHLFKSMNKGTTWEVISPDLTTNDPIKRQRGNSGGITPDNTGAEYHCSIHSISISPVDENVIWVGTDDGNVQCSSDGGTTWMNMTSKIPDVPAGLWVSRVEASHYDTRRAYVTYDGHRSDNFETYIFRTEDGGNSWQRITSGFVEGETVRVIREDLKSENLLFAGTETGVWYSINRGQDWNRLKLNMPTVSVYDLKIHERDDDLIVGTHGRSIWVLDDISFLRAMADDRQSNFEFSDQKENTLWLNISRGGQRGHFWWSGDNPPGVVNTSSIPRAQFENYAVINYVIHEESADSLDLTIADLLGQQSKSIKVSGSKGAHRILWNREWEVKPYTTDESEELNQTMEAFVAASPHNRRLVAGYNRFKSETDPYMKRKILEPLSRGYLSFDLDPKFLVLRAEAGNYKMTLSDGSTFDQGILTIRNDPME